MANQTITTDRNLTQLTPLMSNGQNITINGGAMLTVSESPDTLIGQISINDGEMFIDGENATNPIVFVGELNEEINVNGAGVLRSSLGWWECPTVSNGSANQSFNISSYFTNASIDADIFSGVYVETGRRINYDNGSGVPPEVGDWVFKVSDKSVHGRIVEVSGNGVTGYVVVQFLTGRILNNQDFELHTLQDNDGPDYQKSWTGKANGSDVLEPDVFQGFGNAYQNSINSLPDMGSGIAGFGFTQTYQSDTITFGNGTNGFIPPVGARIRIPNIHFATATTTTYAANDSTFNASLAARYEIETVFGGDIFINGVSYGSASCQDSLGSTFQANYCTANSEFGIFGALARASYDNCIIVGDPLYDSRSTARSVPGIVDMISGADIRDCIGVFMNDSTETTQFGGQTSIGVNIERCIQISNDSNAIEFEAIRINGLTIYDFVMIGGPMIFNTVTDTDIKLLKTQRVQDGSVGDSDQVVFNSSCNNVTLTGWEILNGSCPDDSKVIIIDCSNIHIRGFHFIDDKFDNEALGGAQGEEFVAMGGLCSDISISRCYQTRGNPNEFALHPQATVRNVTIQNCSSEYNGEIEPDGINTIYRGVHGGSGNMGTTTGVELDLVGTSGSNFGDIFRSDTTGMLFCNMVPGNPDNPIEIVSGNPRFTKDADVDITAGDQWIITQPYFTRGHTSFTGQITTARNTASAAPGANQWTLVDIDFQYDLGDGFNGTWLDVRTPSNLTSIPNPVAGIKFKFRFTATGTMTNGQAIGLYTTTSIEAQKNNLHPIDQNLVPVIFTAVDAGTLQPIENARVYIQAAAGGPLAEGTILFNRLTDENGQVSTPEYAYKEDQPVIGRMRRGSASTYYRSVPVSGTITNAGLISSSFMVRDE